MGKRHFDTVPSLTQSASLAPNVTGYNLSKLEYNLSATFGHPSSILHVLLGSFHLKKRFLSQDTNIEVLRHDEWFGGSALTELVSAQLLL